MIKWNLKLKSYPLSYLQPVGGLFLLQINLNKIEIAYGMTDNFGHVSWLIPLHDYSQILFIHCFKKKKSFIWIPS